VCQNKNNPLIGTWQLISAKGSYNDRPFENDSSTNYMIKVISPNSMVFTRYNKKTDSLTMSAQGSITVQGNKYSETITCATAKITNGLSFNYTYTLSKNRWRIEGGGNGLKLVEEYIRID
jgi:hypothetical protein